MIFWHFLTSYTNIERYKRFPARQQQTYIILKFLDDALIRKRSALSEYRSALSQYELNNPYDVVAVTNRINFGFKHAACSRRNKLFSNSCSTDNSLFSRYCFARALLVVKISSQSHRGPTKVTQRFHRSITVVTRQSHASRLNIDLSALNRGFC